MLPTLPMLLTIPALPTLPTLPMLPTIPALPTLPTLPMLPTIPALPMLPSLPIPVFTYVASIIPTYSHILPYYFLHATEPHYVFIYSGILI